MHLWSLYYYYPLPRRVIVLDNEKSGVGDNHIPLSNRIMLQMLFKMNVYHLLIHEIQACEAEIEY